MRPSNHTSRSPRQALRAIVARLIESARDPLVALALSFVVMLPLVSARAQRPDSTRRAPIAVTLTNELDSMPPPVSPRRAFLSSLLLPGYGQSKLGRHKAAAAFVFVEAMSIVMIRESAADVHEARRTADDTVVVAYANDTTALAIIAPRYAGAEIHTRLAHVEDWIALLVANHLFSAADAFVAAHLWDVPSRLGIHLSPRVGGAALTGQIRW